jgi:hypothetical protein
MTYALGYQNIAQLYHQYGADGGDAVLGSVGAMVFLPGVDQRTAEYASKRLGTTTVLQASSVDVHDGNKLDQERSTEVGRALMDASEIRQMTKYKQAVAIISNAPPVRLTFPKFAKACFYTRVNERTCAIWALPTGTRRNYASSFFIVLTPEWMRSWKGNAIEDDVISRLPAIPKPDQLAALMMQEMPSRVFNQQNERGGSR